TSPTTAVWPTIQDTTESFEFTGITLPGAMAQFILDNGMQLNQYYRQQQTDALVRSQMNDGQELQIQKNAAAQWNAIEKMQEYINPQLRAQQSLTSNPPPKMGYPTVPNPATFGKMSSLISDLNHMTQVLGPDSPTSQKANQYIERLEAAQNQDHQ